MSRQYTLPVLTGTPPREFVECIRLMTAAIFEYKRLRPDDVPRFALPPPGVGLIIALKLVWPVVCQNSAAKDLFQVFQDIGEIVGGAGRDPTLTMLTVAALANGLEPETRPVDDFERCKQEMIVAANSAALGEPAGGLRNRELPKWLTTKAE